MKYKKTKLKNGLRIITVPMKETRTAAVFIAVGVGSRYENNKEAGISHFIEHMFFKGTEKRPTALDISSELDAIGGEFNAFTGKDVTGYYVKVDADHFATALDVVSDIYLNSKIDDKEIRKQQGAILQEFNLLEDTPVRRVGDMFESLLYAGNPLGRNIEGKKETVVRLRRKDFMNYLSRFYVANDTVICVAGSIDEQKVLRQVKRYFSRMKRGTKPSFQKIKERQQKPALVLGFKKTDQTHFILGNRAFHENHPDRFALSLLSVILGGNMSSRIFVEVREKRGLAYHVRTAYESYEDCGYLATQAGVEHENLEVTVRTILNEYEKITAFPVGQKELRKAKDYIRGKSVMGLESSDEVAMFFLNQEIKKKKVLTMEQILAKIDQVTVQDIQRVARKVLRKENLNLAVIGPHRDKKKLEKVLRLGKK